MINNLSLVIITWKNADKLELTLQSFLDGGLLEMVDDCILVSQETTNKERQIAKKFGLSIIEHETNLGIEGAWRSGLQHAKHAYCLMMENDCPLIESPHTTYEQLINAVSLLETGKANMVRLRSMKKPGAKFYNIEKYSRYFEAKDKHYRFLDKVILFLRRMLRSSKAKRLSGSSVYAIKNPQNRHRNIQKIENNTYLVPSSILNWTNQSVMIEKQFMVDTLLARVSEYPSSRALNGFQDIERSLNSRWWRKQNYMIAVTPGLFTHLE